MATTLQSIENALKNVYLNAMRTQLNEDSGPFFAMVDKNGDNISGVDTIKVKMQYGRHGGIGNRAEDGTLPTASPRKYAEGTASTKNVFAVISLSSKVIKGTKNQKASIVNELSTQMRDILVDAKDNVRRQVLGDGSGVMSTTKVATATTVIGVNFINCFYAGQVVDIVDATDDTTYLATAVTILDVDKVAGTIKISGSNITTDAGDKVVISGNFNNELTGLKKIMTPDNTLYGINRANNKWLNPNIKHNDSNGNGTGTVADIDELIMQKAIDDADIALGSKVNYIQTSYGVARAWQQYNLEYKRNLEFMDLKGGVKSMSYAGIPIVKELYLPAGVMDFLNTKDFSMQRLSDWDWMQEDGAILSRASNTPAYNAVLEFYGDLTCFKPAGQSRIDCIKEY